MTSTRSVPRPFSFPGAERWGRRAPWRDGSATGRAYGEIDPELAGALARWLDAGKVAGGDPLHPPLVFRCGELVVKFFPPPSVFGWLRAHRALRSAERYFQCLPIPSPRPLIALGRRRGPSLLVREYVAGRLLVEAWPVDEHARETLPPFLASLLQHGVLHGDLHPRNLLWTGKTWLLLDIDGVRHGLHRPARVIEGQWVRLLHHLRDEAGLSSAYRSFREILGPSPAFRGKPGEDWERIKSRVR